MRRASSSKILAALLLTCSIAPALAWDRGDTDIFAIVPYVPGNSGNVPVSIEGLTVGPDGTVYTPSFGFNSDGAVPGPPHLFSFRPNGVLLYDKPLINPAPSPAPQPSPHLLGLVYQSSSKNLLICDLAQGIVWQANPATGKATVFMNTGLGGASGLNALTFDEAGNVYVSDSFQGVIWKTGPTGGTPTTFVELADIIAAGRQWSDPGPAFRRQRRRVRQQVHRDVRGQYRLPFDRQGARKLEQ